jgi:creatinine amidohydrolase
VDRRLERHEFSPAEEREDRITVPTLAAMTWEEARNAAGAGSIAILPIGAIEAHGPHLPLITDIIIAEAMARNATERLESLGRRAVILPSIGYTPAGFAAGFAGTISLRPESLTAMLADIALSLAAQGFTLLAFANSHLDPTHLAALERAAADIRQSGRLRVCFPNLTTRPWALKLGDEFKSGACHAGQFETSVVLAERPELVREAIRAELPANPESLSRAIRAGKTTFEEAGGPRAYFGYPAQASAEEGRATIEALGAILAEAVETALAA